MKLSKVLLERAKPKESKKENLLTCFLSLPDILSFDAKTYHSDGKLGAHWPGDDQIANALLFHDRILIHDHLIHYVESAQSGYTVGHRYDGIRNWLIQIARWKPLILANRILIIPQDLKYSEEIMQIWNEEDMDEKSRQILAQFHPYSLDILEDESGEYILEINEISYLLAALSISDNHFTNRIPFFAGDQKYQLLKNVVENFIDVTKHNYSPGKRPGADVRKETGLNAEIHLPSTLHIEDKDVPEFQNQLLGGLFEEVRQELRDVLLKLRPDAQEEPKDMNEIEGIVNGLEDHWRSEMNKIRNFTMIQEKQIRMYFVSAYFQQISNQNLDLDRSIDRIFYQTLTNIATENASGDRLGQYSFALY